MGNGIVDFSVNITGGAQIAKQLQSFSPRLEASMMSAMSDVIGTLHSGTAPYMQWKNPTGALEQSGYEVITPGLGTLGYSAAHALRRDKGFSGMTDSLGRFYPLDPGTAYLENSFADNKAYIEQRIGAAARSALSFP